MNYRTIVAAIEVADRLEAMFLPVHRLAYRKGPLDPQLTELFGHVAEARRKADSVLSDLVVEFNKQLREINGPK